MKTPVLREFRMARQGQTSAVEDADRLTVEPSDDLAPTWFVGEARGADEHAMHRLAGGLLAANGQGCVTFKDGACAF